jgi:hypothetical protein
MGAILRIVTLLLVGATVLPSLRPARFATFRRALLSLLLPSALLALCAVAVAPAHAAGRRHRPFLGPLPPPHCAPGDRTENGVDGQLTLQERESGASKKPFNCNLVVVGEYQGQGAGHQLLWYRHCAT